jgi:Predicted membrane protein
MGRRVWVHFYARSSHWGCTHYLVSLCSRFTFIFYVGGFLWGAFHPTMVNKVENNNKGKEKEKNEKERKKEEEKEEERKKQKEEEEERKKQKKEEEDEEKERFSAAPFLIRWNETTATFDSCGLCHSMFNRPSHSRYAPRHVPHRMAERNIFYSPLRGP